MYKEDYDRLLKIVEKHYVGDTKEVFLRIAGLLELGNNEFLPINMFIAEDNIDVSSILKEIPYWGIDKFSLTWKTEPFKSTDTPHRISIPYKNGWNFRFTWKEEHKEKLFDLGFC